MVQVVDNCLTSTGPVFKPQNHKEKNQKNKKALSNSFGKKAKEVVLGWSHATWDFFCLEHISFLHLLYPTHSFLRHSLST
jgi:hypothetical protein